MRVLPAAIVSLLGFVAQGPAVPIDHEPHHHVVLANDWVRVFDVTVEPGDSTLYHVHANDYLYVTLGSADVLAQPLGGPTTELRLVDGEVRYTKSPLTHRVVNASQAPFHNITIEVLKTPGAKAAVPADTRTLILENDRVRAERVVLEPGQSTKAHAHPGMALNVYVHPATLSIAVAGGATRRATYKAGDYRWIGSPRTHTITNVGATRAEIVEIDWK